MYEPNKALTSAIDSGDHGEIQSEIIRLIYSDPDFKMGLLKNTIRYVNSQIKSNITGRFDGLELRDDPDVWDEDYRSTLVTGLRKNFSWTRINHLEEVSQHLYRNDSNASDEVNSTKLEAIKENYDRIKCGLRKENDDRIKLEIRKEIEDRIKLEIRKENEDRKKMIPIALTVGLAMMSLMVLTFSRETTATVTGLMAIGTGIAAMSQKGLKEKR